MKCSVDCNHIDIIRLATTHSVIECELACNRIYYYIEG